MITEPLITDLETLAAALPAPQKAIFSRIYEVSTRVGEVILPPGLEPWVKAQFGSIEAITRQKIVRLYNRVTQEEVLVNEQRASRPTEARRQENLEAELAEASQNDIFRSPETGTSEDIIGRVRGKYCLTAGNITKTDVYHGVVIFNDYDPLNFSLDKIIDYIDTAQEWARQIHNLRPEARYFLFFWNCLWRAGASLTHGHGQTMLATGKHYVKIENLRRSALEYRQKYGSNYFQDLFEVHQALGCALEKDGVRILSYLTPFKFYEVMLLADKLNLPLKEKVFDLLAFFRDNLKVTNFNLGLITPPLGPTEESWEGFPCIVRIVDRGSYDSRFSDFGSFELFGATMVVSDPFRLARRVQAYLD